MTIKFFTAVILLSLLLPLVPLAWASFLPRAKLAGLQFTVADFVAPPIPQLSSMKEFYQPVVTTFAWEKVEDFNHSHQPVTYELKIDQAIYQTENLTQTVDLSFFSPGQHQVSLRACDAIRNCSQWSLPKQMVVDGRPPEVRLLASGFEVREAINDDWLLVGEGDFSAGVWTIGGAQSTAALGKNYLSVTLNNQPRLKILTFEWQQFSLESLAELDQVGMLVIVNGQTVVVESRRSDSQWQRAWVDLSQFEEAQLVVQIATGNSGDNLFPSWLAVKNLSTNWVVVNRLDQVQLLIADDYDATASGTLFENDEKLSYWAGDSAGNVTDLYFLPLIMDIELPQVVLTLHQYPDNLPDNYLEITMTDDLSWTSWRLLDDLGHEVSDITNFSLGKLFTAPAPSTTVIQQLRLPNADYSAWQLEIRDLADNRLVKKILD